MEAQDGGPSCGQRAMVIVVDPGTVPMGMAIADWMKLDRKVKSTI
jgi:hypothetical protein